MTVLDIGLIFALIAALLALLLEQGGKRLSNPPLKDPTLPHPLVRLWWVMTTPQSWVQVDDYDPQWDRIIRDLLDKHTFTNITKHTAKLGDWTLWISNHPYASMKPHNVDFEPGRPSRGVILFAGHRLRSDRMKAVRRSRMTWTETRRLGMEAAEPAVEIQGYDAIADENPVEIPDNTA